MRLLIYGAGVIGSLYAALFAKAGYNTSIYARGNRLETLRTKGLLYMEKGKVQRADVSILSYYEAVHPEKAGREYRVMAKTAKRLKRNFYFLKRECGRLSPGKMNLFLVVPLPVLTVVLSLVFESAFGNKFMYQHAIKAPDEMRQLHKQFYAYVKKML